MIASSILSVTVSVESVSAELVLVYSTDGSIFTVAVGIRSRAFVR